MSYDERLRSLRTAAVGALSSYGIPAALFLALALAFLYLFYGRPNRFAGDFPRSPGDFLQASKAERRLAALGQRLAAEPEDIQALAESGRLKYQLGQSRYVEAIADLERARTLGLADVRTFYYLGNMYQAVGLFDFASQEYRRFLNNNPEDGEVRMLLAKLCYSSGDFPCAVHEYETLSAKNKDDAVLLENLALARWKNKQDCSAALLKLRGLGPEGEFLADYAEGRINYEQKDYSKAALFLQKAAGFPAGDFADRAGLLWLAADAAYRNKEQDSAFSSLQELLKLNPGHEEAKIMLAKIKKARKARAGKKK